MLDPKCPKPLNGAGLHSLSIYLHTSKMNVPRSFLIGFSRLDGRIFDTYLREETVKGVDGTPHNLMSAK